MPDGKSGASSPRVLVCGLDPVGQDAIGKIFSKDLWIEVPYDLEKLAEVKLEPPPQVLLFGPPPTGVNLIETAQVARMRYPIQAIYYVTSNRTGFDRAEFKRNGFTDAFLVPIDFGIANQVLKDELARATKGAVRSFRAVQLVDLRPNEVLDFDTFMFMPVNKKHLRISAAGDALDSDRYGKLTRSGINAIHVATEQIQIFYSFVAKKLRALQKGEGLSETERRERMTSAIRNLMASVFNDSSSDATIEKGRSIISDCQQIVKSFITSGTDQTSWYTKMLQVTGAESGSYHHSGNVATFGALFSLAVGVGKPEDIALAGLLHDIGLADLPPEVQENPDHPEYRKHVENTLTVIKFRKMILPDSITRAIAQHHERWSGTGYPKGIAGPRISLEGQLLALADRFDYLTMTNEGRARMNPAHAFRLLYDECLNDPENARFDLELLKKFIAVFPEETS